MYFTRLLLSTFIITTLITSTLKSDAWNYENPEKWDRISEVCLHGKSQSPINITDKKTNTFPKEIKYNNLSANKILNNGHTIQLNFSQDVFLDYDNKKYKLLQVHFHAPAEHVINGKNYDFEAHFVHQTAEGDFAVVGVLYKIGKENKDLNAILKDAPSTEQKIDINKKFKLSTLLPKTKEFYSYSGSLTTPPCTEGVKWIVMKEVLEVSKKQIEMFQKSVGLEKTNRPIQQQK